jgi:hypothetical protein
VLANKSNKEDIRNLTNMLEHLFPVSCTSKPTFAKRNSKSSIGILVITSQT